MTIPFVPSTSLKVELFPGQEKWLSIPENIEKAARRLYEKVGFRQFHVWEEPGCHEVDMEYLTAEIDRKQLNEEECGEVAKVRI